MKSLKDISYSLACQKAYKGQITCPYVVYEKSSGTWGAIPLNTWKILKPGTPRYLVSNTGRGLRIAGWEYTDG